MTDTWSAEIRGESNAFILQSPGLLVLEGDLSVDFGATLEKLRTPGVNSYRARERNREFKDLVLGLMEDTASTPNLFRNEQLYQLMEGELVSLTISILGVRTRWQHVMVDEVKVVGRDGPLFGRGATSGSKHTTNTAWTLWRQRAGEILR